MAMSKSKRKCRACSKLRRIDLGNLMCATCNGRSRCGGVVRAAELTAEHVGHRITWADKTGRHHITLGHVHVETGAGRDVVLIRAKDADPWDAWALDGKRKVQVHA